ncbi:predicted protein [Plenodomus lingam JN3]|uniref:Predicted protein n=1 Tax=Leptosphaeria maculans (strain JN3 / isolate v23.1.3 / race Av1-4-5-6-7-8) TaxID=985895 RepID=E4ZNT6_LEPMJ|nr:predicted protein [Plenodomus lingam JN3]CBX93305.1 predicted protein [Plenodomus lingam JN3]
MHRNTCENRQHFYPFKSQPAHGHDLNIDFPIANRHDGPRHADTMDRHHAAAYYNASTRAPVSLSRNSSGGHVKNTIVQPHNTHEMPTKQGRDLAFDQGHVGAYHVDRRVTAHKAHRLGGSDVPKKKFDPPRGVEKLIRRGHGVLTVIYVTAEVLYSAG